MILDGKALAVMERSQLTERIRELQREDHRAPGLAVVLVGDDSASQVYVAAKEKAAKQCGFKTFNHKLPASSTQAEVAAVLEQLNLDSDVDGILLQLPLPAGLNQDDLLSIITTEKDVDCLHPFNQGLLFQGRPTFMPCTPRGIMKLIDQAVGADNSDLSGKIALVIGRSVLVGKPVASLLLARNATVICAHSRTANLKELACQADLLVAAVGRPLLLKADWVKPGSVVIDVGINRMPDGRLVGDVDFDAVKLRAAAITPVPGGVGPMTIAMLLRNTFEAYRRCPQVE